jgi:hypothetical protein
VESPGLLADEPLESLGKSKAKWVKLWVDQAD